jgi:hypothetical protein
MEFQYLFLTNSKDGNEVFVEAPVWCRKKHLKNGKFENPNLFTYTVYRRQMKSFSIRKATNPNQQKGVSASADLGSESMQLGKSNGGVNGHGAHTKN